MSFESVYKRHFASLFRYVHRWTGDVDLAEDVVQEAFVRFLRATVPESDARRWLFRVAGNLLRDDRRRRLRRKGILRRRFGHRAEAGDAAEAERSLTVDRVRRALEALPERDRRMLLMREEGFSYRQIADEVGVATGSVGTLLARALERFREAYEPD